MTQNQQEPGTLAADDGPASPKNKNKRHSHQENQEQEQKQKDMPPTSFFLPPAVRKSATSALSLSLNRALFAKTVGLAAATVTHNNQISRWRKALHEGREILRADRLSPVIGHPDTRLAEQGRKCLLLDPGVRADSPDTWGPVLRDGVDRQELGVIPYELQLDYDYWTYHDIVTSILPEGVHDEIPGGFTTVGHVAHLNLRDQFLPYKKLIAEVLLDKNPHIRTVINKTDTVGAESEFRTFQYEVLAGDDDLRVQISEGGCVFEFDYAKVYWNSRLETEHRRLISLFQPGEVVCDVMAGIGPFAVPAGKKGVFVWANDMNPESYACLRHAIDKNKVSQYVRPFCQDGRTFIREAADSVLQASREGFCAVIPAKRPSRTANPSAVTPPPTRIPLPPTISHFVMNLPASAITFLSCFRGLYAGQEALFSQESESEEGDISESGDIHGNTNKRQRQLPIIHVHCFGPKGDGDAPLLGVCARVSRELGLDHDLRLASSAGKEGEVAIHDVRDVAPAKRMFCASFRLPRQIAFAARD